MRLIIPLLLIANFAYSQKTAQEWQAWRDSIENKARSEIIQAKIADERRYETIGRTNFPFIIDDVYLHINSAGGVSFRVAARYFKKEKTIKYAYVHAIPYNAVGDSQQCTIRGVSEFTGEVTGPISASSESNYWTWENAWYNPTITCIKIVKFRVVYMDGTSYTYINELPKIMGEYDNDCRYRE